MGRALLTATLLMLLAVACSSDNQTTSDQVDSVRVGVLPDQAESRLREQYEPLLAFIGDTTGVGTELVIPSDYNDLLGLFESGQVDLAWFGGLTFLQAEQAFQAMPLAMRDVDLEFTSDFLVSAESTGDSIADFAGMDIAFGPERSTSGHLMPRDHLSSEGLSPETLFSSVVHSSGHDETARWVRDGVVQIGAANTVVIESMLASGELSLDEIRVVERTNPYRNYVWATQPDLDEAVRILLLDAFLALDSTAAEQARILDGLGARGFVPASVSDFKQLRNAADALDLLEPGGLS